jgi:hypothetical protein
MAITRAQQAKQLLAQGGRTGFQGGGRDAATESFARSIGGQSGADEVGSQFGFQSEQPGGDFRSASEVKAQIASRTQAEKDEIARKEAARLARVEAAKKRAAKEKLSFADKFKIFSLKDQIDQIRGLKPSIGGFMTIGNMLNPSMVESAYTTDDDDEQDYFEGVDFGISGSDLEREQNIKEAITKAKETGGITQKEFEDAFYSGKNYSLDKDGNIVSTPKTRPTDNTGGGGGDGIQDPCKGPNPPAYCFTGIRSTAIEPEEEEVFTPNLRLLAEGGRAGFRSAGAVSAAYGDAAAKKGPVERPGGGGGDGPSGPPRVINPPPSGGDKPIIPNLKEGFTQHNINNQKLKNAVALGLISNDEYNILGGYDVNQTMGLNPFMTGMTSGLYNVYQTIKGDQPASEIYGDVKRNVQGSFGLPEDLQAKYDNIMSMSSDELTNQLADLNLANQRTAQMAGGGMPYEGGIMDLESARQMYGLGKLVKKVTRGIKKIVKSPIGKAAIIGGLTFGIPGVQSGFFSKGLMGTQKGLGLRKFLTDSIFGKVTDLGIAGPNRAARTGGLLNFLKDNPLMAIGGASALAGLYTAKTEDEEPLYAGADIDEQPYKDQHLL